MPPRRTQPIKTTEIERRRAKAGLTQEQLAKQADALEVLLAVAAQCREDALLAKPTQRHYRACAKGDPEMPSPSTITAHGMKFQEACQKAGL